MFIVNGLFDIFQFIANQARTIERHISIDHGSYAFYPVAINGLDFVVAHKSGEEGVLSRDGRMITVLFGPVKGGCGFFSVDSSL